MNNIYYLTYKTPILKHKSREIVIYKAQIIEELNNHYIINYSDNSIIEVCNAFLTLQPDNIHYNHKTLKRVEKNKIGESLFFDLNEARIKLIKLFWGGNCGKKNCL